jgi:hypothetical protein
LPSRIFCQYIFGKLILQLGRKYCSEQTRSGAGIGSIYWEASFFSADIRSLFQSGLMPAENFEERKWRLNQIVGRSQYRYHKLGLAYPKWIISFPPLDRKDLLANAYNKKNYFYRSVYNRSEEELTSVHKDENLKKFERYLGGART